MSESHATKDGEFQPVGKAQAQSLPGYVVVIPTTLASSDPRSSSEAAMHPTSESTKLEGAGQAYEYAPAGKLKGCKSLITGGECVSLHPSPPLSPLLHVRG